MVGRVGLNAPQDQPITPSNHAADWGQSALPKIEANAHAVRASRPPDLRPPPSFISPLRARTRTLNSNWPRSGYLRPPTSDLHASGILYLQVF